MEISLVYMYHNEIVDSFIVYHSYLIIKPQMICYIINLKL
jgi:hypothetical protein